MTEQHQQAAFARTELAVEQCRELRVHIRDPQRLGRPARLAWSLRPGVCSCPRHLCGASGGGRRPWSDCGRIQSEGEVCAFRGLRIPAGVCQGCVVGGAPSFLVSCLIIPCESTLQFLCNATIFSPRPGPCCLVQDHRGLATR